MNVNARATNIADSFSVNAAHYDRYAGVQREVAERLGDLIAGRSGSHRRGRSILEVGCGTGNLSKNLLNIFSESKLLVTDVAEEMLKVCAASLGANPLLEYRLLDVRAARFAPGETFDVVASSFLLQWIENLQDAVTNLINVLEKGGAFYFAYPSVGSFPEWSAVCTELNLPCSANRLPGMEIVDIGRELGLEVYCEQVELQQHFHSALEFFRSLKGLGASVQLEPKHLSQGEFRELIDAWDRSTLGDVRVTYQVILGEFIR